MPDRRARRRGRRRASPSVQRFGPATAAGRAIGGVAAAASTRRLTARNREKLGNTRVGGGGVHLFVGVAEFDFEVALENGEERFAGDGSFDQTGKFGRVQIAGFESERLAGGVAETFEF